MSSAVGGGAARATSSPQEQLTIGKALLQQKKYSDASEALSLALEMFVQAFGEVGAECAEVYATPRLRANVCRPFCSFRVALRLSFCPRLTRVLRVQVLLLRTLAISRRGGESRAAGLKLHCSCIYFSIARVDVAYCTGTFCF
jgi:hypothetical protein